MKQVNIHDAKTHLSRLVAEAARGESFVIAKAGRPMVEVRAVPPSGGVERRIGFLGQGGGPQAKVKEVGGDDLVALLEGDDPGHAGA